MKQRIVNLLIIAAMAGLSVPVYGDGNTNDWPLCPDALPIPPRPAVDNATAGDDIQISADNVEVTKDGESILTGNVEITRNNQQITAESIDYNKEGNTADLSGKIKYWDDDMFLRSNIGHIEFESDQGTFSDADYILNRNRARGHADSISHHYPDQTRLKKVDYTTCDPDSNFWKLSASEIKLNHETKTGLGKNVVLKIKDIPVFYTPILSFPLSKERKTGFLFPSFGNSNRNGYEIRTPFYFNISPEADMTLAPRYMSDSGLMLDGELRYLLGEGHGQLDFQYLPNDNNFGGQDRSLLSFHHDNPFGEGGDVTVVYNRVSDQQFFEDFGSSLNTTSTRFLDRRAEVSYLADWWQLSARVQDYQTTDTSINPLFRPYKRLPQIQFEAFSPFINKFLNFRLDSEISYFDRENDLLANNVNGSRVDLYPSVSFPIYSASAYVEPRAGFRLTQYNLTDTGPFIKSNPRRSLPIFSLDSGVFFDRDVNLFGRSYLNTLEPRLYYLYIPYRDQSGLPVFDTGIYDFSFDSLFRENRFTGPDRITDANQITLAVTTRFMDYQSGIERGRFSIGQIYYMTNRDVFLPGGVIRTEASSPLVAEAGLTVIDPWKFTSAIQWDPENHKTEKLGIYAQYNPGPEKVLNMGYRVRRTTNSISSPSSLTLTDIEQTDVSFQWPINNQWSAVGRWNYGIPEGRTVDMFGGIEYRSCCWSFRAVARRFITDASGDYNTGIFFQIELNGLAGIGQNTAQFLQDNIPGFQSDF